MGPGLNPVTLLLHLSKGDACPEKGNDLALAPQAADRLGLEPVPPSAEATSPTVQALHGSVGLSFLPDPLHVSHRAQLGSGATSVVRGPRHRGWWEQGALFRFWLTPFLCDLGGLRAKAQPQAPLTHGAPPALSVPVQTTHVVPFQLPKPKKHWQVPFFFIKKNVGGLETTKSISEAQTVAV